MADPSNQPAADDPAAPGGQWTPAAPPATPAPLGAELATGRSRVHPTIELAAAYGWRIIVITAVAVGGFWLLSELWVLVLTLVIGVYLARVLDVPATWLRNRGLPPALSALVPLLGFIGALALMAVLLVPTIAQEFDELGPTLTEATNDVERWLIEDSPFELTEEDVDDLRRTVTDAAKDSFQRSEGSLISGAVVAVEVLTGVILALITAFFILKDGSAFQSWILGRLPEKKQNKASRLGQKAWATLGGYLKGVGILGTLEGFILGVTIALVGGELAWPVAILTFFASFVPIVGAVVSGVVATLVALATAGTGPAVIVAITALVVQQLDNDLLSPVIYGRSLDLHPLVVLFSIVVGGALFGLGGTILAVPVTAVVINVLAEARRSDDEADPGDGSPDGPSGGNTSAIAPS